MAQLNEFDLAFVVDTTGSMGGLIAAAQRQMTEMIDALATAAAVDMRLGIVEYRDHPPQDSLISGPIRSPRTCGRRRKRCKG
jgi:hypothetical protein